MLERLTHRALLAVVDAQAIARRLRHRTVDAPHLLLGILGSADTTGGAMLGRAGLRYGAVESMVERLYERVDELPRRVALSAHANKVLALSLDEARDDGHALIGTAHLALACTHVDHLPSLKPFVAGREQAIRAQVCRPRGGTLTQRRAALQRANEIRMKRAQLKRDLKLGRCTIDQMLADPPTYLETAKVFDVLLAVPGFGRVTASKILSHSRISSSKTIGGLSWRQRHELVDLLRR
jgi:ATP-dependent Clp protease ATP-binding subunit ClpA